MISVDEAQDIILRNVSSATTLTIDIKESNGYILAKDVHSVEAVPAFPASIKVKQINSFFNNHKFKIGWICSSCQ